MWKLFIIRRIKVNASGKKLNKDCMQLNFLSVQEQDKEHKDMMKVMEIIFS